MPKSKYLLTFALAFTVVVLSAIGCTGYSSGGLSSEGNAVRQEEPAPAAPTEVSASHVERENVRIPETIRMMAQSGNPSFGSAGG